MKSKLPSYAEAAQRVQDNRATALDQFVVENEPAGEENELAFRAGLCAVVLEAESTGWDAYHRLMALLRETKGRHGMCEPRRRRACTPCNAQEELDGMVKGYRGRPIQRADASAPAVIVHRDFPGEHGGADCWCRPVTTAADSPRAASDVARETERSDG